MAQLTVYFFKNYSTVLRSICNFRNLQVSNICYKNYQNPCFRHFCTSCSRKTERVCWEGSSNVVLLRKLEISLKNHQLDEAWEAYSDFKSLYGFPSYSLMSRLMTQLSYSSDPNWLRRACDLVFFKGKTDFIRPDLLTKLLISLARAQMPVPASMILRMILEKEGLPPMDILGLIIFHMVKTEIGACLASNILVEICECFKCFSAKKPTIAKLIKPNTMIFNLVLDACVRFGSSLKGQQIIELMAQVGVIADAHTIVIIARIHEMNGQRDELKKFKDHIDQVSVPFVRHYRQFYDSLLNLHLKFNDIDAACGLVMDMYRCRESLPIQEDRREPQKPCFVPIGSHSLSTWLRLQISPQLLQKDSVLKAEGKQELVLYVSGNFVLSNKALAKLIIQYKRFGRISELSKLLSTFQKQQLGSREDDCLCSDVINACIHFGWLETAHDILEDLASAGTLLGTNSYTSLLTAYYKAKMFREAEALLKQIHKAGLVINMSHEMFVSTYPSGVEDARKTQYSLTTNSIGKSDLAASLVREMREEERAVPFVVNEFNSSIYFFMKAKMIADALKTYRRMQEMKIQPTVFTFFTLVDGYSSLEMYREITIVWRDIKRNMENGNLVVSRDLYEFLLLNFLRGGYFERVMEVIGHMKEHEMYTDKWMYKKEFLKFHKDLYRNLKASNARNEVQGNRIEHVWAFRKWVGIQ